MQGQCYIKCFGSRKKGTFNHIWELKEVFIKVLNSVSVIYYCVTGHPKHTDLQEHQSFILLTNPQGWQSSSDRDSLSVHHGMSWGFSAGPFFIYHHMLKWLTYMAGKLLMAESLAETMFGDHFFFSKGCLGSLMTYWLDSKSEHPERMRWKL